MQFTASFDRNVILSVTPFHHSGTQEKVPSDRMQWMTSSQLLAESHAHPATNKLCD